eukprot:13422662-Ditylum_brightwellii.AAC.1
MAHFQRANFGCTNCDAKACYNRIVPVILLLAYFKAGVFGIGQGSTDGSPGWTLISNIILKVYHRMCKEYTMQDPTKEIKIKCNAD